MENEKLWVYIGKGSFIDGVPARDLTAHDWERFDEDTRAAVEQSPLYRRAPQPAKVEQPQPESKGTGAKSASSAKEDKE